MNQALTRRIERGVYVKVIAHRGASGHLPENTLPAYELALEMRADMIEIDLHLTRDGHIVVCHDAELEGIGGQGEVRQADLAQVRQLDAGGGALVPTLDEVLDGVAARIPFNLELKWGGAGDYPGIEAQVLEALSRRSLGADILFSSFRVPILERLRSLDSRSRLALLVSPRTPGYTLDSALENCSALGAEALNPHLLQVDDELVERAHGAGLAVNVYTVDPEDVQRKMLAMGVDGVFTNLPDRLRRVVDGDSLTP